VVYAIKAGFAPEYIERMSLPEFSRVSEHICRVEALDRLALLWDNANACQGDIKGLKELDKSIRTSAGMEVPMQSSNDLALALGKPPKGRVKG
jgi:hypothetical protein